MARTYRNPLGDSFTAWARRFPTKKLRQQLVTRPDRRQAANATRQARYTHDDVDLPRMVKKTGTYGGGWYR